jgi:hypothetical protein
VDADQFPRNFGFLLLTDLLAGAVPASWWRWLRNTP